MTELPFAYKGEAQLVRWSETPKGRTVTLLLDPFVGESHPFKALKCGENGQRMQLAAVLVGDDDQPVPPKNGPVAARPDREVRHETATVAPMRQAEASDKPRTYTRSQRAAIMCQDETFCEWLDGRYYGLFCETEPPLHPTPNDRLKQLLGINSKKELDIDPEAAARFDALRTDFELRDLVR